MPRFVRLYTGIQTTMKAGLLLLVFSCGCGRSQPRDRLTQWENGGLYAGGIAYASDSRSVVVSNPATGRGDLWWIDPAGNQAGMILGSEDSEIDPCFSANGQFLYFSRFESSRYQIKVLDMRTKESSSVLTIPEHAYRPVPLPDEESLLFVRIPIGAPQSVAEIWKMDLKTKDLKRLTDNLVYDGSMIPMKDNHGFLFCQNGTDVLFMNLETLETKSICKGEKPILSEDETRLFVSRRREPSFNYDLWMRDLATGEERSFPFDGTLIQAACRAPVGKIAILSDLSKDRVGRIAILDPSTAEWRELPRVLEFSKYQVNAAAE